MIVYWSMLLWVPLVYIMYSITYKKKHVALTEYSLQQKTQDKVPIFFAILVFGYFIFWIGMRKYVADTTQYIWSFEKLTTNFSEGFLKIDWDGKGPLFWLFSLAFKCFISDDFQWWLMAIAVISCGCLMIVIRKYSVDFFFSSFLFIAMVEFIWPMNGMRQFVCVAFVFLFSDLIKDGKFFKFLILTLILSLVHTTVVLMIPIYFVVRAKPWSTKIVVFIIGIVLITVFAEPFFNGVESALSGTAYSGLTSSFNEDDGVNPVRVLFFSLPPAVAFLKRDVLTQYYDDNPMLPIAINMSLVSAALYFVGAFTSGILIGRLPIYCELYNLLLIPFLLKTCFNHKELRVIKPVYIAVLLVYFYLISPSEYHSELTHTVGRPF